MKFNVAEEKKDRYNSLQELKTNKKEKLLSFMPQIEKIRQDLYDDYNIENIYLYGDILEKTKYDGQISLMIEMENSEFEKMVDSKYLDQYKDMNFCISLEDTIYYKKDKWEENGVKPNFKLLI